MLLLTTQLPRQKKLLFGSGVRLDNAYIYTDPQIHAIGILLLALPCHVLSSVQLSVVIFPAICFSRHQLGAW
jgi:hypothetical protein